MPIRGLDDSKRLSPRRRADLDLEIRERAVSYAVARADVEVIDAINILQATMQAMREAVGRLDPAPRQVLVDGNRCPDLPCPVRAVVGGDATVAAISAASILAKVARDREMIEMDRRYIRGTDSPATRAMERGRIETPCSGSALRRSIGSASLR